MATQEDWLRLAPKPANLPPGVKWHIFLSYRSVERSWVLSLYDTLVRLGYEAFMDQFVLTAASNLLRTLEENLNASEAGILVWSPRSEDSAWCQEEYDTFVTKQKHGGFRFVVARIRNSTLPPFAANKVWVDFTEQREGPSGAELLRLLYGLQHQPLPKEAVKLATSIEEETQRALARIRAATDDQDKDKLVKMSQSTHVAWRSSHLLPCACAQALVSIGAHPEALALLDTVIGEYPKGLRPQQLRGLALARAGRWREAKPVLGELYQLGERDTETMGLYARTWMDAYRTSGNELHLRRSRDLYAEAFEASPSTYYVGINAAAKSILLNELDVADAFAKRVQDIVGTKSVPNDYWRSATVAEVQLMQRQFLKAAGLYSQALAGSPGLIDDHRSTQRQVVDLLGHLEATDSEAALILAAFSHLGADPGDPAPPALGE